MKFRFIQEQDGERYVLFGTYSVFELDNIMIKIGDKFCVEFDHTVVRDKTATAAEEILESYFRSSAAEEILESYFRSSPVHVTGCNGLVFGCIGAKAGTTLTVPNPDVPHLIFRINPLGGKADERDWEIMLGFLRDKRDVFASDWDIADDLCISDPGNSGAIPEFRFGTNTDFSDMLEIFRRRFDCGFRPESIRGFDLRADDWRNGSLKVDDGMSNDEVWFEGNIPCSRFIWVPDWANAPGAVNAGMNFFRFGVNPPIENDE